MARIVPKLKGRGMPRNVGLPPSLACNKGNSFKTIVVYMCAEQVARDLAHPCLCCNPVALTQQLDC